MKRFLSYPIIIICILLFATVVRVFFIEIFTIPSYSMEDAILMGDKILVCKLSYGPRMPKSPFEIPWINLVFLLNEKSRSKIDSVWWNYKRLRGFSSIKHNQVVVFNRPDNPNEVFVKRCTGLPGDTFAIKKAQVMINNKKLLNIQTIKFISRINFNDFRRTRRLIDSLNLNVCSEGKGFISVKINEYQKRMLSTKSFIDSITLEKNRPDTAFVTYPHNKLFPWSIDDFGPVTIPYLGMKIDLNKETFILYKRIINSFESSEVTFNEKDFYINGIKSNTYVFKKNYYFMMGDDRHDSNDSRYWGFIPETYIIGKATLVLFSYGKDGFRRKRVFKVIT